ncbi:hypothetical protein [Janibacter terrae]|uniref:hypothetical protein n=1 Tax=Janibacter terrae TaxID=103817 RepID=UPI00082B2832|nr:hypothetical protein [Janibacter terrae]
MPISRRTAVIALASTAALVGAAGAVSAATSSTPPQLATVTHVGIYEGAFTGFPGNTHRVSMLMKRGNTSTFGKNQQNYVLVESYRCAPGATVPLAGAAGADCPLATKTSMRNTGSGAYVSSTGRSATMTGNLTSRSGKYRKIESTLRFYQQNPSGEHSFGYDMTVRNNAGRTTGLLGGKKPVNSSVLLVSFGE